MGKVIAGMAMSLDGFVTDRHGSVAALYPDMEAMRNSPRLQAAIASTGAVVMGRRAFEMGDPDSYAGAYEFQVPLFVVTHAPPARHPKEGGGLTFTFVTDGVASAVRQARAAAGPRDVTVVGGASVIQQCLREGLADELHLDVRPLLLGGGLRLFETFEGELIALELIGLDQEPLVTALRYRVQR
jgi:dihydrofolate reductase